MNVHGLDYFARLELSNIFIFSAVSAAEGSPAPSESRLGMKDSSLFLSDEWQF